MSNSEAELTLIINARNLAAGVVKNFSGSLGAVASVAEKATARIGGAFRSVSNGVVNGLGNLTETLAQGGGLGEAMFMFGAYMAGQAAEALLETMIEKLAGSALVSAIGAPISAGMSALGSVMAAAIPIGMALLPVLLVAAIVAAIVFLINNPQIVDKILEFAGGVVDFIINGLAALGGLLLDTFKAAFQLVVDAVGWYVTTVVGFWLSIPGRLLALGGTIVTTIINGLASFPGKVADIVRSAFANLRIDVGPFHISGKTGVTIDLPNFNDANAGKGGAGNVPGKATGGWVGLHGPEIVRTGELGPEYIRKAGTGTGDGGGGGAPVIIQLMLDGREVGRLVDERLFYALRSSPAALGPG